MMTRSRILIFLLLAGLLLASPARATLNNIEKHLSLRMGRELDDQLRLRGVVLGVYTDEYPIPDPALKGIARFLIWGVDTTIVDHQSVNWGFELAANHNDRSDFDDKLDLSLIFKARVHVTDRLYYSFGIGPGWNQIRDEDKPRFNLTLGGTIFFAPEANIGYEFQWNKQTYFVEYIFSHRSNGGFVDHNESLNWHLVSVGTRF